MTVEPTPPRQPQVYLTGNHVVPDVGLGTTVVEPPTTAVVAAQTDPMEFPFVAYPRGTKWWLK